MSKQEAIKFLIFVAQKAQHAGALTLQEASATLQAIKILETPEEVEKKNAKIKSQLQG
jgi:hypothetical protein